MLPRSCVLLALVGFSTCSLFFRRGRWRVCDPATCKGPVYYYEELGCIPIYENSSSCCPIRYNCDQWKNLPNSKCLVNGRVYESGDVLPVGEVGDACTTFICNGYSAPTYVQNLCARSKDGCYLKQSPFQCCSSVEVCPEKESDVPTCNVDGKIYKDGDRFTPTGERNKICYCAAGYNGENVEPFCITLKPGRCGNALKNMKMIRDNCTPVYDRSASPHHDCNSEYLCYKNPDGPPEFCQANESQSEGITACLFGDTSVAVGVREPLYYDDRLGPLSCTCEVPPVMTCKML